MNKKWNKNGLLALVIGLVFLVLYNIVIWVIPFERTNIFWSAYIFTLISFIVVGISLYYGLIKNENAKSKFYGFPIARIGIIYGISQLVISFIFMILSAKVVVWIAIVVFSIILAVAVMGLFAAEVVRSEIIKEDEVLQKKVSTMRYLQSKVSQMDRYCSNSDIEKMIKNFSEELKYSDPVSAPELEKVELDLMINIEKLQEAVEKDDFEKVKNLINKSRNILMERNKLCKLYKK